MLKCGRAARSRNSGHDAIFLLQACECLCWLRGVCRWPPVCIAARLFHPVGTWTLSQLKLWDHLSGQQRCCFEEELHLTVARGMSVCLLLACRHQVAAIGHFVVVANAAAAA